MFKEWGFLLSEIWVLLAMAGLIGLFAGWLIWGRRDEVHSAPDTGEADRLRAALADCRGKGESMTARIADLERQLAVAKAAPVAAPVMAAPVMAAPVMAAPAMAGGSAAIAAPSRPEALAGPRGGKADDLKLIKGVGPKLEALCNKLGFWHFDQIANWTPAEVAWVDENLEGFKGRVSREEWIVQARDLAAGKAPRPGGQH
jgi:predicted flap endonuclease-1-like 5' DNA nuclease